MSDYQYTNIFYMSAFSFIGGVETFMLELAKIVNFNNRDLTIVYGTCDKAQLKRLQKYCRTVQINSLPKPIRCKRAFFNYNVSAIDDIVAEEYWQVVHADFSSDFLAPYWKPIVSPKIQHYIAVSENNANVFERLTGIRPIVINNPITIEDEPRIMTLVSAQRISPEKGCNRLVQMIQTLERCGVPYCWHMFTNGRLQGVNTENVVYHTPTPDVRRWLKYADYTVLLSDTEGFPYTIYESLCLGTPIIVTDLAMLPGLPATKDNSIILDFDLSNLDVWDIYKRAGTFKFKCEPRGVKEWLELIDGESTYEGPQPDVVIQVCKTFWDKTMNRHVYPGERYEVEPERAEFLLGTGYVKRIEET